MFVRYFGFSKSIFLLRQKNIFIIFLLTFSHTMRLHYTIRTYMTTPEENEISEREMEMSRSAPNESIFSRWFSGPIGIESGDLLCTNDEMY